METIAIFELLRRHTFLIGFAVCRHHPWPGMAISFFSPLVPEKYEASASRTGSPT